MTIVEIDILVRFIDWCYKGMEGLKAQQVADLINQFADEEGL